MYHYLTAILLIALFGNSLYGQDAQYHADELYLMLREPAARQLINDEEKVQLKILPTTLEYLFLEHRILKAVVAFPKIQHPELNRVIRLQLEQPGNMDELITQLNLSPLVEYAERVPQAYFEQIHLPNDLGKNDSKEQWYLHKIKAPEAWGIGKGNKTIKVAITDNAVDWRHPDLIENIWTNPGEIPDNGLDDDGNGYIDDIHGYDVAEDKGDPGPSKTGQLHGTHTAGLAGAVSDNNLGIASIGYKLSLIPVKIEKDNQKGTYPIESIAYAIAAQADIISCSWVVNNKSETFRKLIAFAQEEHAIIVAGSGNNGRELVLYPAAYPGVIAVGGSDSLDKVASFSNYGSWISVIAPGRSIKSTLTAGRYGLLSGTSMATPIVSGLLSLMKSHYPELDNNALKQCLLSTTDSIPDMATSKYKGKIGSGRINAYKAMKCVDDLKKGITAVSPKTTTLFKLNLYPNPATKNINLHLQSPIGGSLLVSIKDYSGRTVCASKIYVLQAGQQEIVVPIDHLSNGIYMLTATWEHETITRKLVILSR